MIPVYWLSMHQPEIKPRHYWDQAMLEDLFANKLWNTGYEFEHHAIDGTKSLQTDGGIVVIPARHHVDDVETINELLRPLKWCVVVLTGDEESAFPWGQLDIPVARLWVMTPNGESWVGKDKHQARYLGSGYTPQTREHMPKKYPGRPSNWFFAGQITHGRREQMAEQLRESDDGRLVETEGFTEGLQPEEYFREMTSASVVPCPAGPISPDNFRLFEALESGCVPIADSKSEHRGEGFWDLVFGQKPPFPVIDEWEHLPQVMEDTLTKWPRLVNRTQAFWQWYKRRVALQMSDDIQELSGVEPEKPVTTVLVPTSWIPSHPGTHIIEETIDSIREQLPTEPVYIMIDGLRKEQEAYRDEYEAYVRNLMWLTNHHWNNVLPILFGKHMHQANMTRQTLKHVKTPTILFAEHDTPIYGEIPWPQLVDAVNSKKANLIRLHHESFILPPHRHLMLDRRPKTFDPPLVRTVQWSQRPHLASVEYYKRILNDHFTKQSRTMIEDRMHQIVEMDWRDFGVQGWQKHRLWMFYPEGDLKRSWHTDGRENADKYEMVF